MGSLDRLMPLKAYLFRDDELHRLVHMPPYGARSRAWGLYGMEQSLRLVCKWCWKNEMLQHGLEVLDCPIPT